MNRLSIITVALNEETNLARLKRSIDRLAKGRSIEIETVLVDNGSSDNTVEVAQRCGFDLIVPANRATLAECRNLGLQNSSGNWIAFVDADCEVASDWLLRSEPLLKTEEDVLIGWPTRPPTPRTWIQRAWQIHWQQKSQDMQQLCGQRVVRHAAHRMICSANMAFNRDVAKQLGGFNPSLQTGEDTDFAIRAHARGTHVYGVPEMTVIHHGEPATLRDFFRQQLWHMNRQAYAAAWRASDRREGMNALYFTLGFAAASLVSLVSLVALLVTRNGWLAPLLLSLPAFVVIPAFRTCLRAGCPGETLAVSAVYFAYGSARLIKLLGICRTPRSWRTRTP